jgi:hypothetical protein
VNIVEEKESGSFGAGFTNLFEEQHSVAEEISKTELFERERNAWRDVSKRLDFLTELASAKADKAIMRDAAAKLSIALNKYKAPLTQRLQVEFAK